MDLLPKTCENFRQFCVSTEKPPYSYKGLEFHRVIKGFIMESGDIMKNGTGGFSIYGERFPVEDVWLEHSHRGVLTTGS